MPGAEVKLTMKELARNQINPNGELEDQVLYILKTHGTLTTHVVAFALGCSRKKTLKILSRLRRYREIEMVTCKGDIGFWRIREGRI